MGFNLIIFVVDYAIQIICQLKGGTHILCINNTDTRELKAVHLVPQYQDQPKYPQTGIEILENMNNIYN